MEVREGIAFYIFCKDRKRGKKERWLKSKSRTLCKAEGWAGFGVTSGRHTEKE